MPDNEIERNIRKLQNLNPLSDAENETGKPITDEETFFAAVRIQHKRVEQLKAFAGEMRDLYSGIEWDEYKAILAERGFQEVLSKHFHDRFSDPNDPATEREILVSANPEKKLFIYSDSITIPDKPAVLNGGICYGVIDGSKVDPDLFFRTTWSISMGADYDVYWTDNKICPFNLDIRKQLFMKLDTLESAGISFADWHGKHTLFHFYTYEEMISPDSDMYRERNTQEILAACPPNVRTFMGL